MLLQAVLSTAFSFDTTLDGGGGDGGGGDTVKDYPTPVGLDGHGLADDAFGDSVPTIPATSSSLLPHGVWAAKCAAVMVCVVSMVVLLAFLHQVASLNHFDSTV